jgi:23S rRNA (pseudouridine1915-N3)-methyltransferase
VRLRIVAVGRVKEPAARALCDDYVGRIRRYCPCDEIEITKGPREAAGFAKAIDGATVVALTADGDMVTSAELARRLERFGARGKGVVAFLLGGADGLPAGVLAAAHARISMSRLTFPHRLARILLAEQLYRAFTILRGEPYDR